jgi:hypothetical protein
VSAKKQSAGGKTDLQPVDRIYASSQEFRTDGLPKSLRTISSDIVLVVDTLANEENGWRKVGETKGIPKADANISISPDDSKAKSFRVVVSLFPLTTQAANTLMD